jgi:PAS domain-containing protein
VAAGPHRDSTPWRLGIYLIASLASVCGLAAYVLLQGYHASLRGAEDNVANLALSLEHYLRVHVGVADRVLAKAVQAHRVLSTPRPDPADMTRELGELQGLLEGTSGLRGSDAQGRVVYGTGLPPGPPLSVAGRQFFREARESDRVVIGLPLKSRISGDWVMPMARALRDRDGGFAGVVYVNTDVEALARLLRAVDVGPNGSVVLIDAERRILLRVPALGGAAADEQVARLEAPQTRAAVASGAPAAVYQAISSVDGVARTVGIRRIGDYPLYVVVTLSREDVLAGWRASARLLASVVGLLVLCAAVYHATLLRSWREREAALATVTEQEAELARTVQALSASEERLRMLAEGLPQLSWVADAEGRLRYLGRQWQQFTGAGASAATTVPAASADEPPWLAAAHPDDRAAVAAAWRAALSGDRPFAVVCRLRRHDGAWRVFDGAGLPQHDAGGARVAWVEIGRAHV